MSTGHHVGKSGNVVEELVGVTAQRGSACDGSCHVDPDQVGLGMGRSGQIPDVGKIAKDGRCDDDASGRLRGASVAVGHFVNERIIADKTAAGRVGERAVGVDDERAVGRPNDRKDRRGQRVGGIRVGVVVQQAVRS